MLFFVVILGCTPKCELLRPLSSLYRSLHPRAYCTPGIDGESVSQGIRYLEFSCRIIQSTGRLTDGLSKRQSVHCYPLCSTPPACSFAVSTRLQSAQTPPRAATSDTRIIRQPHNRPALAIGSIHWLPPSAAGYRSRSLSLSSRTRASDFLVDRCSPPAPSLTPPTAANGHRVRRKY